MNTKIKAVAFDVGGVLCDWETVVKSFAKEIGMGEAEFIQIFLKYSFDPVIGSDLGYMTIDEFMKKLTADLGVWEKAKDWRQRFVPGFKRIEPSFQLLEELKGKYRLALLTNAKVGLWDEWKEGNIRKYFEIIVDSSEVHVLKPDKKIFQILLKRLRLKPEECLFIDDGIDNIQTANKLGFKTVHFADPKSGVKKIRQILGFL